MTAEPDGLTAVLLQLGAITRQLAELDQRHATALRDLAERATAITTRLTDLEATAASHAATLAALDGQVARLAAGHDADGGNETGQESYRPVPAPRWWRLGGPAREQAVARLRAWVEQVYQPCYGYLAAGLGECWEQHPLCLVILDWLSELWSVLYLSPARTEGTLAGQAEWHTRLVTAAADLMARETRGCRHTAPAYYSATAGGRP